MENTNIKQKNYLNRKYYNKTLFFKAEPDQNFISFEYLVINLIELANSAKFFIKKSIIIEKNGKIYDVLLIEEDSESTIKQKIRLVFNVTESWNTTYNI
jgi:hypothetical protein